MEKFAEILQQYFGYQKFSAQPSECRCKYNCKKGKFALMSIDGGKA